MKIDITKRTFEFALRIVKLCRFLDESQKTHRALVNQLIRSGTSVGANVEEAQSGQSRADFLSKISISCKEARETLYWLRLISASNESLAPQLADIIKESNEIVSILTSIIKSTKDSRPE
ncbi:MAG: four helix bundle protein [Candidatus Cloacimonetes bacterium]|nr:four helix bundle protein [Candidatus Cloacimonadota bacterium]